MDLRDHLLTLEEQLAHANIRGDADALKRLLAEEFREFGKSGRIFTKHQIVDLLTSEAPRIITIHDFVCRSLSSEAALVTYRSYSEGGEALRSSLWIYGAGRWRMLFHEGTKVQEPIRPDAVC